ncbi:hypothetical protein P1P75_09990 [Streptomyces sp. ID05-39B]|nr:hypothetical protein [Streptomyces sp. ID05-39B]MDX3526764.1 hypothetical protein [Streptomyces sp. ID05-39B]
MEADTLDRRVRGGQEVSQLVGSLAVELFGERRDEHDVRAQARGRGADVTAFQGGSPARGR